MARTGRSSRVKELPKRTSKNRQPTPEKSSSEREFSANSKNIKSRTTLPAESARNADANSIFQSRAPKHVPISGPPPDSNKNSIAVLTLSSNQHGTFHIPRQLLRDRSPLVDAKCLEINSQHMDNLAASAAPQGRKRRSISKREDHHNDPLPDYRIELLDVEHHVFSSYVLLLDTDSIELDVPYAPLKSTDEAWRRLVELYLLCERLEDEISMWMVIGAVREHVEIEFPSEDGVSFVYDRTARDEEGHVVGRILADQVSMGWSDRDVMDLVLGKLGLGWSQLREDVVRVLIEGRGK
ncbi:hypothetical protein CERZMDRAFT_99649 [Cercospora zeae-maydis SCOH1-5]|uniref:Uncharacterized protein n=1 Tax=Cercospora zeae-maydis SCOH1-5 TaxID=717836 RepID=A0A6A6FA12_9PEZI|nr:hypothetical protein CERZMDRAFT_99649 [Cercospora zeae-maydis SCOH1-5]